MRSPLRYCLDSNVYIQSFRTWYGFDLAPGFWEQLLQWAREGLVRSPEAVYEELLQGSDDLARWIKEHRSLLIEESDASVVAVLRDVVAFVEKRYEPQHGATFLDGADPWVVAHAKAHDLVVVTMESRKNEQVGPHGRILGKVKLPNVCEHFNVPWIQALEMFRRLGLKLT